jgi:hypothetical protein
MYLLLAVQMAVQEVPGQVVTSIPLAVMVTELDLVALLLCLAMALQDLDQAQVVAVVLIIRDGLVVQVLPA